HPSARAARLEGVLPRLSLVLGEAELGERIRAGSLGEGSRGPRHLAKARREAPVRSDDDAEVAIRDRVAILLRAGRSDDPAGKDLPLVLGRVVDVLGEEVGMAREDVD